MCLVTDQKEPLIAKEDIIVYKLLDEVTNINPVNAESVTYYVTSYLQYPIEFNKLYVNKQKDGIRRFSCSSFNITIVEGGFYHAYFDLELIPKFMLNSTCCIYKAIIPKSSAYYINRDLGEIASKQITILNEKVYVPFN